MILLSERPTNADVLQLITRDVTHKPRKDATTLVSEINDLCVVVWAVDGRYHWFLGNVKKKKKNFRALLRPL